MFQVATTGWPIKMGNRFCLFRFLYNYQFLLGKNEKIIFGMVGATLRAKRQTKVFMNTKYIGEHHEFHRLVRIGNEKK